MIDSKFVLAKLEKMYPNPHCELNFENNYQLIVAVILSAQCTDKRVNMVTPALFEKYPTIKSLSEANVHEVEDIIKSCGLYQAKAKNLIAMSKKVVEEYSGQKTQEAEAQAEIEEISTINENGNVTGFDWNAYKDLMKQKEAEKEAKELEQTATQQASVTYSDQELSL